LWRVGITNTTGTFGTIDLYVSESSTGNVHSSSTEPFNIFNEEYTQIVINRTEVGSDSQFQEASPRQRRPSPEENLN
jgi:hypothetical protein